MLNPGTNLRSYRVAVVDHFFKVRLPYSEDPPDVVIYRNLVEMVTVRPRSAAALDDDDVGSMPNLLVPSSIL